MNISTERQKLIVYLVLTVAVFAVFWQTNRFNFINFDDQVYVTENLKIRSGLTAESVNWAFTTKYFGLWNPLVWISYMADYQFFRLKAGGYHLTNLILHMLSTLLLFWLFNRMTGALWRSAFVAAVFALHPLHVESVAWIAERKDVLSAFFWMLTLCFYVYYTEKPGIGRYLTVLFAFVLALMSKPIVVTLPVVMILLDYWPLNRFESKKDNLVLWQVKEKILFFILSAAISLMTLSGYQNPLAGYYSIGSRIANACVVFVTYLEKTLWPYNLAVFYPFPSQIPLWQIAGSLLIIIVVTVFVIVKAKSHPYLFAGWLWYGVTIFPVIGIIQIGIYSMADRYHYLSSIGIAAMLAWGGPALIKNKEIKRKILIPVGVATMIIMSVITWWQCGYWHDSKTLFGRVLEVTKNNYLAHNSLGLALFEEGKTVDAIHHYNESIRIKPDFVRSYNNRGIAWADMGQYQKAMEDYNSAIHLSPDFAEVYNNRGIAYSLLGIHTRAVKDYTEAIRLKPDYFEVYNNRGNAYFALGDRKKAIEEFTEAIRLKPDNSMFYSNRADAYFYIHENRQGCVDAQYACVLGNCKVLKEAQAKGDCN
jgi:protein O-mannosyl-transferase